MESPDWARCPISQDQWMDNPVLTIHGQSFDYNSIHSWLNISQTCPITRQPLFHNQIIPNRPLRDAIRDYLTIMDQSDDKLVSGLKRARMDLVKVKADREYYTLQQSLLEEQLSEISEEKLRISDWLAEQGTNSSVEQHRLEELEEKENSTLVKVSSISFKLKNLPDIDELQNGVDNLTDSLRKILEPPDEAKLRKQLVGERSKEEGNEFLRNGDLESALIRYDDAISICPDNDSYHFNRAVALNRLKRYQESTDSAKRSSELNPLNLKALRLIGSNYYELGKYALAVEEGYGRSVRINQHDPESNRMLDLLLRQRETKKKSKI